MGEFSWIKADIDKLDLCQTANIVEGKPYKFLIPKEFGGGFIKEEYQQYGHMGTKELWNRKFFRYDMYELLAFWNRNIIQELLETDVRYDGEFTPMKEYDKYTDYNRLLGIAIAGNDCQMKELKYPLKLVSCRCKETYETCEGRSYSDLLSQGIISSTKKEIIIFRKDASQYDTSFSYNGYHFVQEKLFSFSESHEEILSNCKEETLLNMKDNGKRHWNYEEFINKSHDKTPQIFICLETGKKYYPTENGLLQFC